MEISRIRMKERMPMKSRTTVRRKISMTTNEQTNKQTNKRRSKKMNKELVSILKMRKEI